MTHILYDKIKSSDDPKKCVLAICEALEDENIDDNHAKKVAAEIRTDLQVSLKVHTFE